MSIYQNQAGKYEVKSGNQIIYSGSLKDAQEYAKMAGVSLDVVPVATAPAPVANTPVATPQIQPTPTAKTQARDFYKLNGSYYYNDTNQKILNIPELQTAAKAGGKEIQPPVISSENAMKSGAIPAPKAQGEVIAPITPQTPQGGANGAINQGVFPQYQVLNLEAMTKYKPDQYERLADGAVVLKAGIVPIEGTVKPYGQVGAAGAGTPEETPTPITPALTIPVVPDSDKALADALALIDGADIPPELKTLFKGVVKNYKSPIDDVQEIIKSFNAVKASTIDPYIRELAKVYERGVADQWSSMQRERTMETETLQTKAGEDIRQAKTGLEKAGMTFTGKAVEILGKESALPQAGTPQEGQVPAQTPFGGMFYEGLVPQTSRLMATSARARYEENLKNLTSAAEQRLGTEKFKELGIPGYTPTGGITGTIETQKQQEYGQSLNQLIEQYRKKQELLTNQPYPYSASK